MTSICLSLDIDKIIIYTTKAILKKIEVERGSNSQRALHQAAWHEAEQAATWRTTVNAPMFTPCGLTLMKVAVVRVRVAYGLQLLYSLSNMFNILNANNHAVSTNTIEWSSFHLQYGCQGPWKTMAENDLMLLMALFYTAAPSELLEADAKIMTSIDLRKTKASLAVSMRIYMSMCSTLCGMHSIH